MGNRERRDNLALLLFGIVAVTVGVITAYQCRIPFWFMARLIGGGIVFWVVGLGFLCLAIYLKHGIWLPSLVFRPKKRKHGNAVH